MPQPPMATKWMWRTLTTTMTTMLMMLTVPDHWSARMYRLPLSKDQSALLIDLVAITIEKVIDVINSTH
jgi:hypothetical protein